MRRRILWWSVGGTAGVLLVLAGGSAWLLRPENLRRQLVAGLATHLNLEASVDQISVRFLPRPRVTAGGLTLRVPGRADLPPFISIAHLWVDIGLLSAFRRHVETVHVGGLKIAVPPRHARANLPGAPSATEASSEIIIDHLISHDAELAFVPKEPGRPALTFRIHDLQMNDVGFGRVMPFYAKLTNPVPTGLVETRGTFGPWHRDDPTTTPLAGDYTFTNADLSTINGIGGTLSSVGKYEGQLTEISATGTTETPDFSLDLGGRPLPLSTTFSAIVDGTNGTTKLVDVDARLLNTRIKTRGAITNLAGPGRHAVDLEIEIADGRFEDILALAIDAPEPMLVGDLSLESTLSLPPGKTRVPRRLQMKGRFGLGGARFTDRKVQERLQELSRRSLGKSKDDPIGRALTNLRGTFTMGNGRLRLSALTFQVPGATVALAGTYALESGAIDFRGTLSMKTTVSKAVGGFKSIFLKPFDFLFRGKDAGAVVPIRVTGTRDAPKLAIEMGKVLKR